MPVRARFISKYFILWDAIVNEKFHIQLFITCLQKHDWFLYIDPESRDLSELMISSSICSRFLRIFCTQDHVIWEHIFASSFSISKTYFFFLSGFHTRSSSTMLNGSGKNGHLCLVPS